MAETLYNRPGCTFLDGVDADSSPFFINPLQAGQGITLSIYPITGSQKWQYTTYPESMVIAGTANYIDWESGLVSVATSLRLSTDVTAVKLVVDSGSCDASIMGLK